MHLCFDFIGSLQGTHLAFQSLAFTFLAQEPAPAPPTLFSPTLMFVGATFFLFYFLVIAPEKRKKREEEDLRTQLTKNDRVVTIGGIHATVASVTEGEDVVTIKVDNNTRLKINRSAISHVVRDEEPTDGGSDSSS